MRKKRRYENYVIDFYNYKLVLTWLGQRLTHDGNGFIGPELRVP